MTKTVEVRAVCQVEGRRLSPCGPLEKALTPAMPSAKAKGLFMPQRVILATGQPGTDIVQLHSGGYVGRGVALNFCPFCGTSIKTWEAPDSAVKVNDEN